ncbi:MAG: hypothetical protein ACI936_002048 [Paraglaciecola sp.]|jgi:hypothetical protein
MGAFFVGFPFVRDIPQKMVYVVLAWQILSMIGMVYYGRIILQNYKKSLDK